MDYGTNDSDNRSIGYVIYKETVNRESSKVQIISVHGPFMTGNIRWKLNAGLR